MAFIFRRVICCRAFVVSPLSVLPSPVTLFAAWLGLSSFHADGLSRQLTPFTSLLADLSCPLLSLAYPAIQRRDRVRPFFGSALASHIVATEQRGRRAVVTGKKMKRDKEAASCEALLRQREHGAESSAF